MRSFLAPETSARPLEGEDTWLSRLKKERDVDKKTVFYGVDVWTMLYHDIWDCYETIDSFYLPVCSISRARWQKVPGGFLHLTSQRTSKETSTHRRNEGLRKISESREYGLKPAKLLHYGCIQSKIDHAVAPKRI